MQLIKLLQPVDTQTNSHLEIALSSSKSDPVIFEIEFLAGQQTGNYYILNKQKQDLGPGMPPYIANLIKKKLMNKPPTSIVDSQNSSQDTKGSANSTAYYEIDDNQNTKTAVTKLQLYEQIIDLLLALKNATEITPSITYAVDNISRVVKIDTSHP